MKEAMQRQSTRKVPSTTSRGRNADELAPRSRSGQPRREGAGEGLGGPVAHTRRGARCSGPVTLENRWQLLKK